MIKDIFGSKEILKHDIGYCKLYDTKYGGNNCTKMYFVTESPSKFEFLKNLNYPNILPVYKITNHSIFTKKVVPFLTIFDKTHIKYNEYIVKKLRDTVVHIHDNLKIHHGQLEMDALFIDELGNVLLGKFGRSDQISESNKQNDNFMLNSLSKKMIGKEINQISNNKTLFEELEKKDLFDAMLVEEKKAFLLRVYDEKDNLIDSIKTNIFHQTILDISKSEDKDYKIKALDILNMIDSNKLQSFSKILFGIIDSSVRLYLLKNLKKINSLNDCIAEISLGLRVRDNALKMETLNFIFANEKSFNDKGFSHIIEMSIAGISDSHFTEALCKNLCEIDRTGLEKPVYKLIIELLATNKNKSSLYRVIDKYFVEFDKYKLATELLPALCSKLTDKEDQDKCFISVEKIFSYLKKCRNELNSKEWSLRNILPLRKSDKTDNSTEMKIKINSDENSWEWEDTDIC